MLQLVVLSLLLGHSWSYHLKHESDHESDWQCDREVDMAIVGAGPSGTYTAYKLREANLDIELFEYSDLIGGRLLTPQVKSVPDITPELEVTRLATHRNWRVRRLAEELNINKIELGDDFKDAYNATFSLRGKQLTAADVLSGNVPYHLSSKEKANQANLIQYYLKELTGFNESSLTDDLLLKLKTKDGRKLYQLTTDEALDLVASSEGKEFVKAVGFIGSHIDGEASAASFFQFFLNKDLEKSKIFTLEGGLCELPNRLAKAYLSASSRHKLTLNRKLTAIRKSKTGVYHLGFVKTTSEDGITSENRTGEHVCTKKAILAIPHVALQTLDWEPLRSPTVKEAIHAMKPAKASEVYLVFPKSQWTNESHVNTVHVLKSEGPFSQMFAYNISKPSGEYVMIGLYSDAFKTEYQEHLNAKEEKPILGSAPGAYKVTFSLKQEIVSHLSSIFGIDKEKIDEPVVAASKFMTKYPYGGGWTVWRAGYNLKDVQRIIQHPSLTDEIFVVGSDHFISEGNQWVEGALRSVDELFEKYF